MTITDATHALARARRAAPPAPAVTGPMRLADAIRRVEPTWVEAVAVVQAVCAQVPAGRAVPALDAITIGPDGAVAFAVTGAADDVAAVAGAGQLLMTLLGRGECPMQIWEAADDATLSPARVGTPAAFATRLTSLPAAQGARELARYHQTASQPSQASSGPRPGGLSGFELTARASALLAAVLVGGIGMGISLGTYVVTHAAVQAPAAVQVVALWPQR